MLFFFLGKNAARRLVQAAAGGRGADGGWVAISAGFILRIIGWFARSASGYTLFAAMIESYAISHAGGRAENQDCVLADPALGLFAVADGMGGHRGGAVAAELAIFTLRCSVESSVDRLNVTWPFGYSFDISLEANRLITGIKLANRHVLKRAGAAPEFSGMGTTLAALLVGDGRAVVGNAGDSRVYLARGGCLQQLSQDDTLIESPLGALMSESASIEQLRHVLTQAVGSQDEIEVHIREQVLEPGDQLLLTSDGLHGSLGDDEILASLGDGGNVQRRAELLLESAMRRKASDNVSIVLLGYGH